MTEYFISWKLSLFRDNPLFEENQNGKHIDIDQLYSATSDNNSIDDNEVDSQDSAIDADENVNMIIATSVIFE